MDRTPHEQAGRFRDVDAARETYGRDLVDRVVAGCFEADPAADALVTAFRRLPGGSGWRLLDQALTHGTAALPDDAPAELAAVLDPACTLPSWVDPERLHRGAVAYWRPGAGALSLSLTCGALAYGYQSASLSRPLAATGRLEKMVPRRIAETARWVLAVTTPGGMLPGAEGHASSLRVRLVHALVRRHLLEAGGWDVADWGVPISASDAASTAMGGFLTIHLDAMHDLGVHYSREELEDMTHLWAWIATVMGVPAALAPSGYAEARRQVRAALAIDSGPNEDGPRLMRALLDRPAPIIQILPSPVRGPATAANTHLMVGFTRRWMGDEMADTLGVGHSPLTHAAVLVRPVSVARGLVMRTGLLGGGERVGTVERALVRRVLAQGRAPEVPLGPEEADAEPALAA
ncbi:DUF2236 domain-containing protein [Paraconexibacter antarcticus]|uniref:DUF2236 domain-containing protein n=1 Tax=Paraconexibacter antarcticus TaxID=2949664 RepID=A0ABY5DWU1_9ACTN|nr:oxygenase MpaB family protein [Paraconexibacter antarcticus]UTI65019.1 DUF2236 domain-containing protein [Paraconexibacter antarcticus]